MDLNGEGQTLPETEFKKFNSEIATFCYTSGTTGIPKAAMIPHKSLLSADILKLLQGNVLTM
jgi:long-subunit acyl-CoA synthetase (AMP-forming)